MFVVDLNNYFESEAVRNLALDVGIPERMRYRIKCLFVHSRAQHYKLWFTV